MNQLLVPTIFGIFVLFLVLNIQQSYGDEESPIITITFLTDNVIDLDENSHMIRADIRIENYDPQDGYHFMQVTRLGDGKILKNTEIMPKVIDDDLFGVQILHYIDPEQNLDQLLGEYELRIYSEFGNSEAVSNFSIIKSSLSTSSVLSADPSTELISKDLSENSSNTEIIAKSESKIPSWVRDIFVWYANDIISENELLAALEYLISKGTINVDS